MSLIPCSRCGQPVGEDEQACSSCGQSRSGGEPAAPPAPSPPAPAAPPAASGGALKGGLIGAACAFAAVAGWSFLRGRAAPPPAVAAAAGVPAAVASSSAVLVAPAQGLPPALLLPGPKDFSLQTGSAAAAGQVGPASAGNPGDSEAELAPTPKNVKPNDYVIYGVVYDLATKKPVQNAVVALEGRIVGQAVTDVHGWYQLNPFGRYFDVTVTVNVYARGYENGALMERDPPLASLSDADRHTIQQDIDLPLKPLSFQFGAHEPRVELNLAMVPQSWPAGMAPAKDEPAEEPAVPEEPDEKTCRFYGLVYDLATLRPVRRLAMDVRTEGHLAAATTDGKGHYTYDVPVRFLASDPAVVAAAPGYRPGVVAERDPPMRRMTAKKRRGVADELDLAFDPTPIPTDCDDGLVRFDLAVIPQSWPER